MTNFIKKIEGYIQPFGVKCCLTKTLILSIVFGWLFWHGKLFSEREWQVLIKTNR